MYYRISIYKVIQSRFHAFVDNRTTKLKSFPQNICHELNK
jgi:hypothetical protein